ncbi:MAG: glycosyltransferase family 4 protein [Bacteroidia bacterium]
MYTIIHIALARTWRGGEQQVAYLVQELIKQGCLQVVVAAKGSEMEKWCDANQVECLPVIKRTIYPLLYARWLKRLCQRLSADLVHVHDAHAHNLAFASALSANKTPVVVSRRVDFRIQQTWISRLKYNHRAFRKIICVSDAIKEIMKQDIRDQSKLVTVHSGIDLNKFANPPQENFLRKEFNVPDDHLLIGNVAALAPHKDYFTFLDTIAVLVAGGLNARFFMIGEGEQRQPLEAYIREKQLQDHVVMTGFRKDVIKLLQSLDIFLVTSQTEGLGTSVLDAFAAGVPVVGTRAGGIPELVAHEQTGLLAEVQDHEGLAAQVLRLINDKPLRENIRRQALQKVQQFSKEQTAHKTLEIYRQVVG